MGRSCVRRAFTLLELLIVVAVLALLAALSLPAVQRMRESANRVRCANNLHQLGVAAHAYAANHRRLPPAVVMPYDNAPLPPPYDVLYSANSKNRSRGTCGEDRYPFGPNWAVLLLPYIEQNALFQQANVHSYPGPANPKYGAINFQAPQDYWKYDLSWRNIRSTPLKLFVCPSDQGHGVLFTPDAAGYGGYAPPNGDPSAGTPGTTAGIMGYAGANWARGNYGANAGPAEWGMSRGGASTNETMGRTGGVMCVQWGARIEGIPDGSSNTIMLNELRVGVNSKDRRGVWALGFPGSSVTAGHAGVWAQCERPNDHSDRSDRILDCRLVIGGNKLSVLPTELVNQNEIQQDQRLNEDGMGCDYWHWYPPTQRNHPNITGQARSRHPLGVNACFADGSVHFIRNSVSPAIWFSMNSSNDGQPYEYDF